MARYSSLITRHSKMMPIVRIDLLEGRDAARKAELMRRITEVMVEVLEVRPEQVRVLLSELPPEHWAIGGVSIAEREKK
jgi:4-oxalocrotonate tautomerase